MQRLSLENVVGVAWIVTLLTFLVLLAIYLTDPPAVVRLLCLVVIPAGCLAFPIAVIGSLLLAFRQLGQPRKEDAADYDDELKTEPSVEPDSRQ
jgi:hypothetical protein